MKNFKELRVWQNGMEITKLCYKLTPTFPANEKFGLISQINRAAISITANIAEGSSRKSEKDKYRFLEIALGSSFELESLLLAAIAIELVKEDVVKEILKLTTTEQKMLMTFMELLK